MFVFKINVVYPILVYYVKKTKKKKTFALSEIVMLKQMRLGYYTYEHNILCDWEWFASI